MDAPGLSTKSHPHDTCHALNLDKNPTIHKLDNNKKGRADIYPASYWK